MTDEQAKLIKAAEAMATRAHGSQLYGTHPYAAHLRSVVRLCTPFGADAQIVAWLHDTLEDTDLSPLEIEKEFDSQIRACVEKVTKRKGEDSFVYWARLKEIPDGYVYFRAALIVKAADRLANIAACLGAPPNPRPVHVASLMGQDYGTDPDKAAKLLQHYRDEHQEFVVAVRRVGLNDALVDRASQLLTFWG
ncbi:MAG: HD domain-containing protein [Polyangiales bacterium]